MEGKIFVAGGLNEKNMVSKKCEMYNVSTNEWQFIGGLNTWRVYGNMVCLSGTLYVLGGTTNNRDRLLSVECYDSTENKWIKKASIPVEGYAPGSKKTFTGSVMKLSKGVLEPALTSYPTNDFGASFSRVIRPPIPLGGVGLLGQRVPVFELSDDD